MLQLSAEDPGTQISCPSSFQCASLGEVGYPFTTSFNPSCGICLLDCTEPVQRIQLTSSGPWYDIVNSFSTSKRFLVDDYDLVNLLHDKCNVIESIRNGFRLPRSSSIKLTILSDKALWSCPKKFDLSTGYRIDTLHRLSECTDHNVYYSDNNTLEENGIPGCEIVQYPTQLIVELSDQCSQCIDDAGSCQDLQNDGFRCINNKKEKLKLRQLLALGASTTAIIVILIALVICVKRRIKITDQVTLMWSKRAKGNQNVEAFLKIYGSLAPTRYTYSDIRLMTNSFKHKLGEGGYGTVYEGKLQDGRPVAVKRLTSTLEARGTIGYIAPEVFCRNFGVVSHKSDVYSYGMMVLDMACGRKNLLIQARNNSEQYFPDWIYDQLEHEEEVGVHEITIPDERGLMRKMILVGLWCIQTYPSNRPSMNQVVEMLEGGVESIEMPPKPLLCSPPRSRIGFFGTIVNFP